MSDKGRRPGQPRPRPFGLRELLIVAAIVVVLAHFLVWPPLCRPREKGRQMQCLGNQKRLAAGLLTYAYDRDARLPPGPAWSSAILSVVGTEELFTCPGDDARRFRPGGGPYAMSARLSQAAIDEVTDPAKTPLLWDCDGTGALARRHSGGAVIGFADGHAKWHKTPPPEVDRGFVGLVD